MLWTAIFIERASFNLTCYPNLGFASFPTYMIAYSASLNLLVPNLSISHRTYYRSFHFGCKGLIGQKALKILFWLDKLCYFQIHNAILQFEQAHGRRSWLLFHEFSKNSSIISSCKLINLEYFISDKVRLEHEKSKIITFWLRHSAKLL